MFRCHVVHVHKRQMQLVTKPVTCGWSISQLGPNHSDQLSLMHRQHVRNVSEMFNGVIWVSKTSGSVDHAVQ